ncbi:hypothetical protein QYH69_25790 [Paraburkholderia sp. SARCC-3016]|uniref:hypothetical protein n=1 Tax=Paraburkholderia sp. SARCC-3016 TaxID=3058611 RepID=UPI002807F4BE|nr:hypothetical protein [Paraburkholderia sp. SARCC-3016]MDQ7980655.1 hypothetical protein [Paraburkholderia sp. SARCC-3016]
MTVVDACDADTQLDEHDDAHEQVGLANRILVSLVSKANLAGDEVNHGDRE